MEYCVPQHLSLVCRCFQCNKFSGMQLCLLKHCGKNAANMQTAFSNAFCSMKCLYFVHFFYVCSWEYNDNDKQWHCTEEGTSLYWNQWWSSIPTHICIMSLRWINLIVHRIRIVNTVVQHYIDVIMTTVASQITSLTIVYFIVYSGADQRKHQSSASLAFVNSPHKGPVTRKMFPFDDVIMKL